ncbi:hypothetical protein [Methylorubrum extorquens]|uniref:hypothetical protein n=1 Tax=Methylorubrum extorquens TaxID=408 RepID=UPI002238E231|nr:hypothetical protein [Methylorubrum extorquens]UYW34439.1 hypothetical protein OKB92_10275 [Methylorubrum extorquens]
MACPIATARLPDARDTLQMLATVAHDRVCVVEGAASKAVLSTADRAALANLAADYRALAERIERAAAAATPSVIANTLEAA